MWVNGQLKTGHWYDWPDRSGTLTYTFSDPIYINLTRFFRDQYVIYYEQAESDKKISKFVIKYDGIYAVQVIIDMQHGNREVNRAT